MNGLDGLTTYTATPGQLGFPTCLTGSCLPLSFDPKTLPASQLPARDITIRAGQRAFYQAQFAKYGLNFDLLPNYPDKLVNPRSQVVSIGAEREVVKGLFVGADYVHQHWTDLDRTVDLNAPSPFDRTAPGQVQDRGRGQCHASDPAGERRRAPGQRADESRRRRLRRTADAGQLSRQPTMYASVSYTLSKATNTTEPDGNGIGPNESNIARLGEEERGPSLLDQRHRAVITFSYQFPYNITAGTVTQLASARPFNATTGVDNNGDGANNDRPVVNGKVIGKSAFRGTATSDVALFVEGRIKPSERTNVLLRLEGFNLFNHGNYLGRGQTIYGDTGTANPTFGQLVAVGTATQRDPGVREHRPAADVPAAGAVRRFKGNTFWGNPGFFGRTVVLIWEHKQYPVCRHDAEHSTCRCSARQAGLHPTKDSCRAGEAPLRQCKPWNLGYPDRHPDPRPASMVGDSALCHSGLVPVYVPGIGCAVRAGAAVPAHVICELASVEHDIRDWRGAGGNRLGGGGNLPVSGSILAESGLSRVHCRRNDARRGFPSCAASGGVACVHHSDRSRAHSPAGITWRRSSPRDGAARRNLHIRHTDHHQADSPDHHVIAHVAV